MKKQIKSPSIGAFNAGSGSIKALRPQTRNKNDFVVQYQRLTVWERANNRTRKESRRLIRENKLLATKHKGVWWVALNPECEGLISDF